MSKLMWASVPHGKAHAVAGPTWERALCGLNVHPLALYPERFKEPRPGLCTKCQAKREKMQKPAQPEKE
jgi:hypothetical protein